MDWVWTDTTLSLSSWICVEDIYANIFILKCWRESEKVIDSALLAAPLTFKALKLQYEFLQGLLPYLTPVLLFSDRNYHPYSNLKFNFSVILYPLCKNAV